MNAAVGAVDVDVTCGVGLERIDVDRLIIELLREVVERLAVVTILVVEDELTDRIDEVVSRLELVVVVRRLVVLC